MKISNQNQPKVSLTDILENLLQVANGNAMSLREICKHLSGRGYGVLLTIFSLPFCFPISIPGLSTPFGFLLAFLGLRVAFAKHLWWPNWILKKEVSYQTLKVVVTKTLTISKILQKVLNPRLIMLVTHPILHRMHGILIFALSILLSLPLPIPLTNMLTAIPICLLGLGLLEDDGVAVIVAYVLALICFIAFGAIFYFGGVGLQKIFF
ncbi:MAG: exopolysaccharide biosynthesis protein [Parachlamydiaceae bacterium]|nr:exopolysaccharide biosynthesis protein [Parachlamydiaceae bacterium]